MTAGLIVDTAGWAGRRVGYAAPVPAGLEFLFFLNNMRGNPAKNWARGKPDGVLMGTPVVTSSYVEFSGLSYLRTSYVQAGDCHLLAAAQVPDTNPEFGDLQCHMVTSFTTGEAAPRMLYRYGSNSELFPEAAPYASAAFNVSGAPSTVQVVAPNVDCRAWKFMAGRFKGGTGIRLRNRTDGTEVNSSNPAGANPIFNHGNVFGIGGDGVSVGLPVRLSWVAGYSRALSDAEEDVMYAATGAYLFELFGIPV